MYYDYGMKQSSGTFKEEKLPKFQAVSQFAKEANTIRRK